MVSDLSKNK